ncbi:MAG: nitrogenase component 1 [Synergistaceae bacterium]|nr:nitrogenase component 1 [Synergistaceae bacterium]
MNGNAYCITMAELAERGVKDIPQEAVTTKHLVYSSPATLSYNSPGAQGFGVKRAGLAIPESVELVVSPGCCGRNSTIEGGAAGFSEKIFFLRMDETDLVTGRHLTKIPHAVKEIADFYKPRPKVVVLCVTCADALLGTDMERVCRKAEEENPDIKVIPTYMYALTRESVKPPMVAVRRSIYSLLEKLPGTNNDRQTASVNLLGHFAPLYDSCELYELLRRLCFAKTNEISRCKSFEEYKALAAAELNLVLHPEANLAAEDLRRRLGTPYAELRRLYQADKIHKQYLLFGAALDRKLDDSEFYEAAKERVQRFKEKFAGCSFSIGQTLNAEPFELALALSRYGFKVDAVFANLNEGSYPYIRQLALVSPDTRLYLPASPTMLNYEIGQEKSDFSLGRDAEYWLPDAANVSWNSERQPFGFDGLVKLLDEIEAAAERKAAK